jgi:hypothetical protein
MQQKKLNSFVEAQKKIGTGLQVDCRKKVYFSNLPFLTKQA